MDAAVLAVTEDALALALTLTLTLTLNRTLTVAEDARRGHVSDSTHLGPRSCRSSSRLSG